MLCVARSGFYSYLKKLTSSETLKDKKRNEILERVKKIHKDNYSTYGSPRITEALRNQGIWINHKSVERIMKVNGIKAKTKRKCKQTTNSVHSLEVTENLIQRDFVSDQLNRKWTGDVTYIWTKEGWVYLSVVLDLCSKIVIGWHMDKNLDKALVIQAMKKALRSRVRRSIYHEELIFHSDHGVQYASDDLKEVLKMNFITQSMSRSGDCYDNAVTESFFHSLKTEWVSFHKYSTRQEAILSVFHYIELFYNSRRLHSSIGYKSPVDFENSKNMI